MRAKPPTGRGAVLTSYWSLSTLYKALCPSVNAVLRLSHDAVWGRGASHPHFRSQPEQLGHEDFIDRRRSGSDGRTRRSSPGPSNPDTLETYFWPAWRLRFAGRSSPPPFASFDCSFICVCVRTGMMMITNANKNKIAFQWHATRERNVPTPDQFLLVSSSGR